MKSFLYDFNCEVRVPSLEERAQDLGKIAEALLNRVNLLLSKSVGFTQKQFSPAALRFIESNKWPVISTSLCNY